MWHCGRAYPTPHPAQIACCLQNPTVQISPSKHHPPLFCTQLFSTLQRSQFCASAVQPGANLQKFAEPRVLASDWSRKSRDRCTRQCWPLIGRLVSGQKCTLQNETAGLKTFKAISSVYRCGISTKSCVSSWPGLCSAQYAAAWVDSASFRQEHNLQIFRRLCR